MPTAKHFILQRVVGYTAFASTSPASGLSGNGMTLKQQQSWMEEVVRSLKGSAEKYDLLAEAAHNLESKLHFQKQANEFRYQAQCYHDCLEALHEFAAHLFSFDPFDDVC
jgi:hypothetical protein